MGKDSTLPKHKTITNVEPHGSQPCDVEVALYIIYVRNKNPCMNVHFFLVVVRYEGMQWRAA